MTIPLATLEQIIGTSQAAQRIEVLLPVGARRRQLPARTLLLGMHLALADLRPAHLTRVHHALTGLPPADRARLGVDAEWWNGTHALSAPAVQCVSR